jgi:isoquinoline 1-oxidoreductase beta subunit
VSTRRAFLIGSVAVAGGVAVGFRLDRANQTSALLELESGQSALTPYVIIDQDGITIITPRAEMGQGIHTTLAALVAEELDVVFEDVRVEHGPASDHYANRIMYDAQPLWRRLRYRPEQATGAQTSIRDGFVKMRKAGAAARLMLVQAAADRLGVAPATLETRNGEVIGAGGQRLAYADLAVAAAALDPPEDPRLKPRKDWRILGTSLPRVDMVGKCTGTARYAIDVTLPELLYATIRRTPRLGGEMVSFDASKAAGMTGVEGIVPMDNGVIVVATNTWYAMRAAAQIEFQWGPAPYPENSEDHRQRIEQAFDEPFYYRPRDRGNVETAMQVPGVLGGTYRVPYLAHATMEPLNATAWLRGDRLDIWVGNQFPTLAVLVGANLTGLPREAVRVHTPYMGGGFGRRFEMDDVEAAVRAALAHPGRPVRVTYTREEDLTHDTYRPMASARFRAAVAEGKPVALDLDLCAPSLFSSGSLRRQRVTGEGRAVTPAKDVSITMGAKEQPYLIDHYRVTAYRPEDLLPVGWWRSVGESQNCFFHESIIDELAHAAGQDPLLMRLSLLENGPARRVLEGVAEMSGWGQALPAGHARGVAFALASGQATAQVIEIRYADGRVSLEKAWAAVDVGIALDRRNIEAQVQGALIFGLSSAIFGEITVSDGAVDQNNFDGYPLLRIHQAPSIEVRIHESGERIFGVGEAGTPTAAPALGNAIFAATGQRIRELPFRNSVNFV